MAASTVMASFPWNIVGSHYERLLEEDLALNLSREVAENLTARFLSSGNLTIGDFAWNETQDYMKNRNAWIRSLRTVPFLNNSDHVKFYLHELYLMEFQLTQLFELLNTSTVVIELHQNLTLFNKCDSNNNSLKQHSERLKCFKRTATQLKFMWESYNISRKFPFPWSELLNETLLEDSCQEQIKYTVLSNVFQFYVYPVVYSIILFIGMVGNGTLFFIFYHHKEVRTVPNIMVFNLAIADVFNLFFNAPMYYMIKYHNEAIYMGGYGCKTLAVLRFLNHAVIELSVVAISAQRYFATLSAIRIGNKCCNIVPQTCTIIYVAVVWAIALGIALFPVFYVLDFPNGVCYPEVRNNGVARAFYVATFVFDCIVLPILLLIFSFSTARILNKSARELPSELRNSRQEAARYRSARVVTALAVAYLVSFIPRCILSFVTSFTHLNKKSVLLMYIDEFTNYLIFSNSCLNPIALYVASRVFRKLFNQYIFPCRNHKRSASERQKFPDSRTTSEDHVSGE
ncbi:hypothetical protein C0J52_25239 [Blattella germanica]|nr:hypothetical protein C0J52_25239 [Blattella germanica]